MRRVSSQLEGQSDQPSTLQGSEPQLKPFEPRAGLELPALPEVGDGLLSGNVDEESDTLDFDSNAQKTVEQFNSSLGGEEAGTSSTTGQPPSKSVDGIFGLSFDDEILIYLIAGGIVAVIGGLMFLSGLTRRMKKSLPSYRASAAAVDTDREVRGRFKPVERYKKPPPPTPVEVTHAGHRHQQAASDPISPVEMSPAEVSSQELIVTGTAEQSPATMGDEEFDFSADHEEAEFELYDSEELAEPETEAETSDGIVSLSARPTESLLSGGLSFVAPAGFHTTHFVESSSAQFAAEDSGYAGVPGAEIRKGEVASQGDEGEELDNDAEQDDESVLHTDELNTDAAESSDIELEQEANEFARNFFTDDSNDHSVPAISEDEEAVMNLQDDDSELEFNFDLEDEIEIADSDADFDFEMEDDAPAKAAVADSIEVESDEPISVANEIELAEPSAAANSEIDDSADFSDMFDDESSDDLNGLALEGPAEPAAEVADAIDVSESDLGEIELADDDIDGFAGIADDVSAPAEEFAGIDLADSVEEVAAEIGAPEIGSDLGSSIGDAVGGIGESVSETAQGAVETATEGVTGAIGGLSNTAKTAAAVAGTAGAAAGGGFLAKVFGWGKKDNDADAKAAQELLPGDGESALAAVSDSDEVSDAVASVKSEADVEVADEVEFDLGGDSESGEFDFSLDDEGPEASDDVAEFAIADDEIAVEDVADQIADNDDSSIDLLDEFGTDDEVDFDDDEVAFDLGDDEADDKSFSSMDTLREPAPAEAKSGFSSADTIREPAQTVEPESDISVAAMGGAALAGAAAMVGLTKSAQPSQIDADLQADNLASDSKNEALVARIGELEQANKNLEESTKSLEEKLAAKTAEADSESKAENDKLVAKIEELEKTNKGLEESTKTLEEELAAKTAEAEKGEADSVTKAEHEELVSKVEDLEKTNKDLEDSTKSLEEKLETKTTESEAAIKQVEEDYATKLEESSKELETVKAELAEAKSASEGSDEKDSELEKMRTDLQSAQSSEKSLNQEIASLKQQLADAVANQEDDGMPTSSLMAAAGVGAAGGLMGGKSLMDKSADPADSADHGELKKRFEARLKLEVKARKDAEAHLEQAEEQRNEIAKTLRGLKKELAEAEKAAAEKKPEGDDPKLKALESQLERQSEKMKTVETTNEKLSADLKTVETTNEKLNADLKSAQDKISELTAEKASKKKVKKPSPRLKK